MAVVKYREVMANSKESWEDAILLAIKEASRTLENLVAVYTQDHRAIVKDNKIVEYQVTVKLCFRID